jgi:hypothetical protein
MITKQVIENIKKYSFVTKVVENLTTITVYINGKKRTIPKRVDVKRLLTILNGMKPKEERIITEEEMLPFGIVE